MKREGAERWEKSKREIMREGGRASEKEREMRSEREKK